MKFVLTRDKKALNPTTLLPAGITDNSIYLTQYEAVKLAMQHGCKIGVAIEAPYFVIDIDHALVDGQWSELSRSLVSRFTGAYVEVSSSGTGLHIIGSLSTPPVDHRCKNTQLHIECYTHSRLIVLTGTQCVGSWDTLHDDEFVAVVNEYFAPTVDLYNHQWTSIACEGWHGPLDDDELIKKALKSSSAFALSAPFKRLWTAENLDDYYPHETKNFDHSSADLALCSHLAFWTGKNCERIERLFALSGLMRDKWTKRQDYRQDTILQAINNCKNVFDDGKREQISDGVRHGYQCKTIDDQIAYFKDCVYVADINKIYVSNSTLLNSSQFRAFYGGYVFYLDALMDTTTRNAYEAFTESQGYEFPKVHTTCFKPLQKPQSIIDLDGIRALNLWRVLDVPSTSGDVSPFLYLISKILPDPNDRDILLSYLAACVQYQGVKFQWWVVLQGVEGNGKTFIANAVMRAIGEQHCHVPNSRDIDSKFNAWIYGKTFVFVDEIDVSDNLQIIDALKPLITNTRIEVQAKGKDQQMIDNCANGMMCMNHRDGIIKTRNDRRYCVFFTAQQNVNDIARDGMGGDFFPKLWDWARSDGFAHITHYLRTYNINTKYNPATGCNRAPDTSTTNEVLSESLSNAELEILEAIANEYVGFCGGWISTLALHRVVARLSRKRVSSVMDRLGYIRHPALTDGRASRYITCDGGTPRLYVKRDSLNAQITNNVVATTVYEKAQAHALSLNNYGTENGKLFGN